MKTDFSRLSIAVVGSVNLDIVATVKDFPQPGETVTNAIINRHPGGKGSNQALAAHRLGAKVFMVACVGNDGVAEEALSNLKAEGINLDYCRSLENISTGLALILVSEDGENQIVVAPGANAAFTPDLLRLPEADAIIAQLEVPMATILQVAQNHKGYFCLNAAPAKEVAREVLEHTDLLIVNEIEAKAIGDNLGSFKGILATTLGSKGAVLSRSGKQMARALPPKIEAVDTTGAGDAFTAALTICLVSGMDPQPALEFACRAGAFTATRAGAQGSPTMQELESF
ncbi:MAG: ribokinase [Lysobacterales bacterium]|jgi:ribokinase